MDDVSLSLKKDCLLCGAHLMGECVLFIARVTRWQWLLGGFHIFSSSSSFEVRPQELVPVLRNFLALRASEWHLCLEVAKGVPQARHVAP